jgi:hypothetical protein
VFGQDDNFWTYCQTLFNIYYYPVCSFDEYNAAETVRVSLVRMEVTAMLAMVKVETDGKLISASQNQASTLWKSKYLTQFGNKPDICRISLL